MLRRALRLLPFLLVLGPASVAEDGLTLYLAPTATPGVSAFCLYPRLPVDPLFRPPFYLIGCGTEVGETRLRELFLSEIRRGLPNKLPPPHPPDVVIEGAELGEIVAEVRGLGGGPAVLVVMDLHRRDRFTDELPHHRAATGFSTGWVGWDARYDPGSLEIYGWEWCDPCHSSGPFDNSLVVCGFCSDEIGPVLPRLVWRDRLGRLHSQEARLRSLASEEVTPNRELWYLLGGRSAEGR